MLWEREILNELQIYTSQICNGNNSFERNFKIFHCISSCKYIHETIQLPSKYYKFTVLLK